MEKEIHKKLYIYLYNIVEDELPYISGINDIKKKELEIDGCNSATECFLFANADKKELLYISPKNISQQFQDYYAKITKIRKLEVLVPHNNTGFVCKDTILDSTLFQYLVKKAKQYKMICLYSYASTTQFFELKNKLIQQGIYVITPESPEEKNLWTIQVYGTKAGIRQLSWQSLVEKPNFIMPRGLIAYDIKSASQVAAREYVKNKGIVIKTNKGSGGNGVLLYHANDLPLVYKQCETKIYELFKQNKFWENNPIVIEKFINVNVSKFSAFPNIEYKIHANGRIEFLYYCVMTITNNGSYSGLDMNKNVVEKNIAFQMKDIGYFIATKLSKAGYRGHFDVDMVLDKKNILLVTEINMRNTGGTDIYKLTKRLIGKDFFIKSYVISRDTLKLIFKQKLNFYKFLEILKPVLFSHKTKEGIVITSEDIFNQKQLLYIVYAHSKKRAYDIEKSMKNIIQKIN